MNKYFVIIDSAWTNCKADFQARATPNPVPTTSLNQASTSTPNPMLTPPAAYYIAPYIPHPEMHTDSCTRTRRYGKTGTWLGKEAAQEEWNMADHRTQWYCYGTSNASLNVLFEQALPSIKRRATTIRGMIVHALILVSFANQWIALSYT